METEAGFMLVQGSDIDIGNYKGVLLNTDLQFNFIEDKSMIIEIPISQLTYKSDGNVSVKIDPKQLFNLTQGVKELFQNGPNQKNKI